MSTCDGCNREREVVSCGRDADGAPDAPDLCEECREEMAEGRMYDAESGTYTVPEMPRGTIPEGVDVNDPDYIPF